jgi:hypothetical protein
MSSFFIWCLNHLAWFQAVCNWLLIAIIWWFLLFLTYAIISFVYDMFERSKKKNKKWLILNALKVSWSMVWLPLIAFIIWYFSRLIVALYFSFLWSVFTFNASWLKDASQWLIAYISMSPLFNLILLQISSLLLMFSFKNKVICWIAAILWVIWFIFPLISAILSS